MERLPTGGPVEGRMVTFELLDHGIIDYVHKFLPDSEANALWEACKVGGTAGINWTQGEVRIGERLVREPRLTAFLGRVDGLKYTYNEKLNISSVWPDIVRQVKEKIETATGKIYNVVLINWYENGASHVSWHSDSETDLVSPSAIATLSLGATRPFQLRHKDDSKRGTDKMSLCAKMKQNPDYVPTTEERDLLTHQTGLDSNMNKEIILHQGDLVVMRGDLQKHWRHRIPQTSDPNQVGPRICFTFRCVNNDNLLE